MYGVQASEGKEVLVMGITGSRGNIKSNLKLDELESLFSIFKPKLGTLLF